MADHPGWTGCDRPLGADRARWGSHAPSRRRSSSCRCRCWTMPCSAVGRTCVPAFWRRPLRHLAPGVKRPRSANARVDHAARRRPGHGHGPARRSAGAYRAALPGNRPRPDVTTEVRAARRTCGWPDREPRSNIWATSSASSVTAASACFWWSIIRTSCSASATGSRHSISGRVIAHGSTTAVRNDPEVIRVYLDA